MIAYLIGGPCDMMKMHLRNEHMTTLEFPHIEPIPIFDPSNREEVGPIPVARELYRKVYESSFGYDRQPYSIFVYAGRSPQA